MENYDNGMRAGLAAALVCALLLAGCAGNLRPAPAPGPGPAVPAIDPAVMTQLAPTGVLRVAVFTGNPLIGSRNDATGEISGATVTLGKALAERAGVPMQLVEYGSIARLVDAAGANAWDVTVLGIDAARRDRIDYAPAHVSVDFTYLVGPASRIASITDADRAGVRIAAVRGTVPAILLSRSLQKATFVQAETDANAFDLLKAGKVQAIAQNRSHLKELASRLPGSRVLDESLLAAELAFALPKGRRAALAYVEGFVAQAKAAGLVQRAIDAANSGSVTPPR